MGMRKEFKEFVLRGNMMDLAVGVIVGGAFNGLVTSFVNNIIMPVISLFTGKIDFENMFVALDGAKYATLAEAQEAGTAVIAYGSFITAIINFLILALVVFFLVKGINKMRAATKKEEAPAAPTTKVCPFCKTEIDINATRCPHCTSELPAEEAAAE
jgi:large conductance mechanosensitive channel